MTTPNATTNATPNATPAMLRGSLFFGCDSRGTLIPSVDWQSFVNTKIAPAFPSGFTVSDTTGGYRMPDGTVIREPSHVLDVMFPVELQSTIVASLKRLAGDYARQFQQDSVLLTVQPLISGEFIHA